MQHTCNGIYLTPPNIMFTLHIKISRQKNVTGKVLVMRKI